MNATLQTYAETAHAFKFVKVGTATPLFVSPGTRDKESRFYTLSTIRAYAGHISCLDENGRTIKFLKRWLKDPPSYDSMDVIPHPAICPPNVLNLWTPFEIDADHSPLTFDRDGVAAIRDFIHKLCGRNEAETDTLLDWMSQMLVLPAMKQKAIALVGPPGCGTGVAVKLMQSLLGHNKVTHTWSSSGGNAGMVDSLLVHIDSDARLDRGHRYAFLQFMSDLRMRIGKRGIVSFDIHSYHRVLLTGHIARYGDCRRVHQTICSAEMVGDHVGFERITGLINQPHTVRSFGGYLRMRTLDPFLAEASLIEADLKDLKAVAKILSQSDIGREMTTSALLGAWAVQHTPHPLSADLGTLVAAAVIKSMITDFALYAH